ncbi:hypothetical protein SARC_00878 [Sphaeroforma arctica JP610]|uniref:Rab-GAP TBC domain-containing protein n=1 Tax=Sphaeroforma arctica JP610 TaxID=667725 RepID=A0A0L0GDA0_9EUKA|nr:hypothetical protein SARC_00878 [Sphaeroforma arctica JP610]KNC86985.1 hypothetical protein SARC_00878 [Sphaeroforma arctica JP610]|eukprot:XP_014160887.1 hypothetical protein SARC_00878 [Sphaeroforma arctica JP610]
MSTPQAANNVLRQTPSIKELLLKMETFNADIGKQTDSPGVDGEKFARIGSETSQDGHLPAARSLSSQFMLAASPIARRIFGSIDSAEPLNGNMVPMQAEALESAWIELRNTWDTLGQRKRRNRASELVVHGIPASVRSMMWPVLVETVNEGSMRDLYNTLLRRTSSHAEAIKRDINTIVLTHQELRKLDVKVVSRVVEALVLNDLQCSNITGLVYLSMILLMQYVVLGI